MKSSSTELKKRDKMSYRLLKRLKTWVTTFFRILYRLVSFVNISVKDFLKNLKRSYVSILQPEQLSNFYFQFWKIPLELWSNTKFQAVWNTTKASKRRWLCAIYCWSLGNNTPGTHRLIHCFKIFLAEPERIKFFLVGNSSLITNLRTEFSKMSAELEFFSN